MFGRLHYIFVLLWWERVHQAVLSIAQQSWSSPNSTFFFRFLPSWSLLGLARLRSCHGVRQLWELSLQWPVSLRSVSHLTQFSYIQVQKKPSLFILGGLQKKIRLLLVRLLFSYCVLWYMFLRLVVAFPMKRKCSTYPLIHAMNIYWNSSVC